MTGLATILLLLVPFVPGLRDIPRLIPVHRLIWRDGDAAKVPDRPARPAPDIEPTQKTGRDQENSDGAAP
jgi:hypothetical protein